MHLLHQHINRFAMETVCVVVLVLSKILLSITYKKLQVVIWSDLTFLFLSFAFHYNGELKHNSAQKPTAKSLLSLLSNGLLRAKM